MDSDAFVGPHGVQRIAMLGFVPQPKLDLSRTEIRLPFRARLSEVNVEQAQYVREGNILLKADAIDKAEIEAQIPIARMRALVRSEAKVDLSKGDPSDMAKVLGKLAIRQVEIDVMQPEYAVISGGIEAGAKIIVSDLAPAIEGMPLQGQLDEDVLQRLRADAGAEG